MRPIVWTVSGSGAGLQADRRALEAFGAHGCSAVAALTAQNAVGVEAVEPVAAAMLDAQLAALARDMPPVAIKTGLLGSVANLDVVVRWIDRLRESNPALAVVVDPVLDAGPGAAFGGEAWPRAYCERLLPRATLLTPDRAAAAALLGLPPLRGRHQVEQAARRLRAAGAAAVAIAGGDAAEGVAADFVDAPWAAGWLRLPQVQAMPRPEATGSVFAASATAALALGFVEIEAVVFATMANAQALREPFPAGGGAVPGHPAPGFARRMAHLPEFVRDPQQVQPGFAPLRSADLGLYAIADSADWIARVTAAGVKTVQLRIKDRSHPRLREEVRRAVAACERAGAQLFVNDHWRIALEEGAYGVHLGQEDLDEADLGAIARAGLRLGISTHSCWEVCRAWALRPSYIACGPVHPTAAKKMPWIPQGNANLAYWCGVLPLPVVAIAGMDPARAAQARQCGAAGVAVISGITAAADPEQAISDYQAAMQAAPRGAAETPPLPRPTLLRAPALPDGRA
ncbi:thiamine phosphate synthase [Ramlibacter solisilvae]|uniref:thiamine phosphate synthase n=1 Tax=Ramlibacter tataouinensis TaxID=94132 RepID=UPI000777E23F|nr:thiamine phosphate synthase [Ramlibacter tataouinensis]